MVKSSITSRLFHLQFNNKVSHGLRIYDAHTNLPTRGPASTNIPVRSPTLRTCPPVVQHMWSTNYVPPRTQHLSTVSTEHTNVPRSYPHRRVNMYEPPCSYHHILTTSMNRPAHGTTSPDPRSHQCVLHTQTALNSLRLEVLAWATRPVSLKLNFLPWARVL